jgi:hypothetical protein
MLERRNLLWNKVWQPKEMCDSNITCNYDAATYNDIKVNSISLGGKFCTAVVEQTDDVTFKAKEFIEFKAGFEVKLGGVMQAEITECSYNPMLIYVPLSTPVITGAPMLLIDKFFGTRD